MVPGRRAPGKPRLHPALGRATLDGMSDDDELTSPEVLRDLRRGGAFAPGPRAGPPPPGEPALPSAGVYFEKRPGPGPRTSPPADPPGAGVPPRSAVEFLEGMRRDPPRRPSPELRERPPAAPPARPRKTAVPPPAAAKPAEPAAKPAAPPPSPAHDEFVKRFLRENPRAKASDAEIAWGAAERASTIEF
jgi:hypothetical protein